MGSKKKVVSEYEEIRLKNIEDNKAVLTQLMQDVKEFVSTPSKPHRQTKRRSYVERYHLPMRRNPLRSCRPGSPQRSRSSSPTSSPQSSPARDNHLVVKFGSFTKMKRRSLFDENNNSDAGVVGDDADEEFELHPRRKRRRVTINAVVRRDITSVTQNDLKRVATNVCQKRYDTKFGSTCHQCRQKTDDMKTICTSSECAGVRGQFCGPCLRNRYGEDAREALQDAAWLCPPCRGICNCSFCRRDAGKSSTGILIHLARETGYDDVNSYLQSLHLK